MGYRDIYYMGYRDMYIQRDIGSLDVSLLLHLRAFIYIYVSKLEIAYSASSNSQEMGVLDTNICHRILRKILR